MMCTFLMNFIEIKKLDVGENKRIWYILFVSVKSRPS